MLQDTMAKYGIIGATLYAVDVQGNVAWTGTGISFDEYLIHGLFVENV